MTFKQLLHQFREVSGRHDLVDLGGNDTGAGFYINAGVRHLDRTTTFQKTPARYFKVIPAGTYLVTFPSCRSILEVWLANSTGRWAAGRQELQEVRLDFASPWSSIQRGIPTTYVPTVLRPFPEEMSAEDIQSFGDFFQYMDVVPSGHSAYNGLLLLPPSDEQLMVEVWGNFYSRTLSAPTDTNSWTELHPEVVIMAAMMQLEIVNRNSAGVADWVKSIQLHTVEIEKDMIEEDTAHLDGSEG